MKLTHLALLPFLLLTSCTAAQFKAASTVVATVGCDLAEVFSHDEKVGTLCNDIAPEVEKAIGAMVASATNAPLLAHRPSKRRHIVRVRDHIPERDPGETIDEQYLPIVVKVLAR